MSNYFIVPLDRNYHDVLAFRSGEVGLDVVLHAVSASYGKTYVVVSEQRSSEILAFFTLLPDLQELAPENSLSSAWTSIWLNVMAVDSRYQKRGIGKWMLFEVMSQLVELATTTQIRYLVIQPLHDESKAYFQHLRVGFVPLHNGALIISIDTMRRALAKRQRHQKRQFR